MTKFYLLLLAASAFLFSCTSAVKAYDKGDYTDAIEKGVKKLQKDPYDNATKSLVKSAYTFAVSQHEEAIRNLSATGNDNRYEAILREYGQLQDLYNTIRQSPAAANTVSPTDYSGYLQTYGDKAADQFLENAEKWMDGETKDDYRKAYYDYRNALRYRDNAIIRAKRDEAYDAALTKVLVVPIRNYGGYSYSSSYQLQRFQNDVMRTLQYNMNDGFVRFFSEQDLNNRGMEPDQVLEMNLGRIRIGRPYDERSQHTSTKEVVVKETVYKKDSVVKEYAKVTATITTTKRTLLSEGELYLSLRDPKGRSLWTDRFNGQHRWQTSFANFTGDERALTDADKEALKRNPNQHAPDDDEIMNELYRQIQQDLSGRLRNYFSRLW